MTVGGVILVLIFGFFLGVVFAKIASTTAMYAPLGNGGEIAVSTLLRQHLARPDYFIIENVTLNIGANGTTQIDHIVVSRFGIFVIETKRYKGWIFGDEGSRNWTQVLYKAKFKFPNPVVQNVGHVRAVRALFKLAEDSFHSLVVFVGNEFEFKTEMPDVVLKSARMI